MISYTAAALSPSVTARRAAKTPGRDRLAGQCLAAVAAPATNSPPGNPSRSWTVQERSSSICPAPPAGGQPSPLGEASSLAQGAGGWTGRCCCRRRPGGGVLQQQQGGVGRVCPRRRARSTPSGGAGGGGRVGGEAAAGGRGGGAPHGPGAETAGVGPQAGGAADGPGARAPCRPRRALACFTPHRPGKAQPSSTSVGGRRRGARRRRTGTGTGKLPPRWILLKG